MMTGNIMYDVNSLSWNNERRVNFTNSMCTGVSQRVGYLSVSIGLS